MARKGKGKKRRSGLERETHKKSSEKELHQKRK